MPNHIHGIVIISSVEDTELQAVGDADLRPLQRKVSYRELYEHIQREVIGGREQT